jgi:hypothetical protein
MVLWRKPFQRTHYSKLFASFLLALISPKYFFIVILIITELSIVLVFSFTVPKHLYGYATAHAISWQLPNAEARFDHRSGHKGFVVEKVVLSNAVSLANSHYETASHSLIVLSQTPYRLDSESVVWWANLRHTPSAVLRHKANWLPPLSHQKLPLSCWHYS